MSVSLQRENVFAPVQSPAVPAKRAPAPQAKPASAAVSLGPKGSGTPSLKARSEPELKTQKFILPGVPAPNLKSPPAEKKRAPAPAARLVGPPDEKKEEPEEKEKKLKSADWFGQTQWGE